MAAKSITDAEISIIKTMLSRKMKNRDIQFYFNRQDRPVNSGRITQIREGSYGPKVVPATDDLLDAFLSGFAPTAIGALTAAAPVSRPPTIGERALALFEQRGHTGWFLRTHETDATECKESFCLKPEGRSPTLCDR